MPPSHVTAAVGNSPLVVILVTGVGVIKGADSEEETMTSLTETVVEKQSRHALF